MGWEGESGFSTAQARRLGGGLHISGMVAIPHCVNRIHLTKLGV